MIPISSSQTLAHSCHRRYQAFPVGSLHRPRPPS
jgi:hypothetical protein